MSVPFWLQQAPWSTQQGYDWARRGVAHGGDWSGRGRLTAMQNAARAAQLANASKYGGWTRGGDTAARPAQPVPAVPTYPALPAANLTLPDLQMPQALPEPPAPVMPGASLAPMLPMPLEPAPLTPMNVPDYTANMPVTTVSDFAALLGSFMGAPESTPAAQATAQSVPTMSDIQTSITPQMPYTDRMTQAATNQAVARQHQKASLPFLLGQMGRAGMARSSPGIAARTIPYVGQALAGAHQAEVAIPYHDQMANLQALLQGQQAREHEAQQLARLGMGQQNLATSQQLGTAIPLLQLLSRYALG